MLYVYFRSIIQNQNSKIKQNIIKKNILKKSCISVSGNIKKKKKNFKNPEI